MNKIANTFERIYEYMDRNPDKVKAAWGKASELPVVGPTAYELLYDEMGPYGYPRLNTSFIDLFVLEDSPEPEFDTTWFDKVLDAYKRQDTFDLDIGFTPPTVNVAGIEPATLIL
jgi:hypothetical protein